MASSAMNSGSLPVADSVLLSEFANRSHWTNWCVPTQITQMDHWTLQATSMSTPKDACYLSSGA